MSLYGALYAGVAGLQAQSNKLGIISDNVANVNTIGYKQGSAIFSTLVTNASNATAYSPGGVLGGNEQLVSQQGLLTTTSSPTDIAVTGNGLFVVNQTADQTGQVLYTRAGSFTQDASGNFVNSAGYFLQAWPLDRNGDLPGAPGNLNTTSSANLSSLQTVNVQNLTGTAAGTTSVSLGANLNASQVAFTGSGGTAGMDNLDTANNGVHANDIIVPSATDKILPGDSMTVSTGSGLSYSFNYGGFTKGRSVSDPSPAGDGDSGLNLINPSATLADSSAAVLNNTDTALAGSTPLQGGTVSDPGGTHSVIVTASTTDLRSGDYVTISGMTGSTNVAGIPDTEINGTHQITVIDSTHYYFATTTAAGSGATGGNASMHSIANPFVIASTTAGHSQVTVSQAAHGLVAGDYVTLSGITGTVDGITLNGTFKITSADTNHFTIDTLATASTIGTAGGTGTIHDVQGSISTINGSSTVVVYQAAHGLATGDVVTISGAPAGGVGGISEANLERSYVITVLDANHYSFTAVDGSGLATAATSSGTDGAGTEVDTRTFAGAILDASNPTQPFLGTSGVASFTTASLSFTITTAASGTTHFTYTPTAPNAQLGQFNNLNNLADAINNTSGLTARVVGGRIYIGATDASAAVTFANGSATGVSGPPVQAGIDWVRELGISNVASGTGRFNSLQSLANLVNVSTGLSATVDNPLGATDVQIAVNDPLDTVTFADAPSGNNGSLLAELGLVNSLNGGSYTPQSTPALGAAYDPNDSAKNMASGAIAPQFSRPVSVFDALGTAHNLDVAFLKTGTNSWAVEVFSQPATDVTSSLPNGQVASGTITFNGDGSLRSVSASLSQPLPITWTSGSASSVITFNWGTAGQPFGTPNASAIGKTDGLSQFDSSYNVNFVNQNGAPVGQLSGIAIDQNGFIIASYNNGQTQRLYKIPLAEFTDPNQLQSISGDAFAQTTGSGEVNLKQPGQSGVGSLSSGALEASNVELANQLTDMIVAQRAYQANTKVISTADTLLDDLDQILR